MATGASAGPLNGEPVMLICSMKSRLNRAVFAAAEEKNVFPRAGLDLIDGIAYMNRVFKPAV
jgi:hypothetical protein